MFIHADCIALGLCSNLRIGVIFIVVCFVMGPRVFLSHINYLDEFRLIFSTLMTAAVFTIRWVYTLFVTVFLFGVVNKYDQRKIICCIYSNVTDFTIENTLFFLKSSFEVAAFLYLYVLLPLFIYLYVYMHTFFSYTILFLLLSSINFPCMPLMCQELLTTINPLF